MEPLGRPRLPSPTFDKNYIWPYIIYIYIYIYIYIFLVIYQCIYLSFVATERVSIENTNTDMGITDYLTQNLLPYINSLDAFWLKCQTPCEKPPLPIPRALRIPSQVSDDFTLEISQLRRSWSQEATLLFSPSELVLVFMIIIH